MKPVLLIGGALLALSSTLALAAPESLLPPSFNQPAPTPAPQPRPAAPQAAPRPGAPAQPAAQPPVPGATSAPVIQQLPGDTGAGPAQLPPEMLARLPTLRELQGMDLDEIDELLGLKPQFDIPPAARRSLQQVGIIGAGEGGFAPYSLSSQPASLVRAALAGIRGPVVSRWGHILLRRALASRMDAPQGMDPAEFAALRAALLGRMGESVAARRLVQDVDSANYTPALATAAFDAYLATGDILGICPVMRLSPTLRDDVQWDMTRSICAAYGGDGRRAGQDLTRVLSRGTAPRIDVLLAQRYAGAAGDGRRAVNIEWDDVDELTPWRFGLSRALGVEIPAQLRDDAPLAFDFADVLNPATPLAARIAAADAAAGRGILSSSALVDLYSQAYTDGGTDGDLRETARQLRVAYIATDVNARLSAMRGLWGADGGWTPMVLTAYAAARVPVSEALAGDADTLIASMLTAGLDRNAARWGNAVAEGSVAWAQIVLARPDDATTVGGGAMDSFIDNDDSSGQRRSQFLLAGLAGLGRMADSSVAAYSESLNVNLTRESVWSSRIDRAGEQRNQALVALLAGVGMQGDGWNRMTARHLFHIVRALNRAGLSAEARMIAAEAVARG